MDNIIEKVKNIYPKEGFNKTKKILKIGDKRLRHIINEYELKKIGKVKIDFSDKNFIYVLGLIWADGYFGKKSNTIYIECLKEDMLKFKNIFEKISNWSYYERSRYRNEKLTIAVNAYITDKYFYEMLIDNDYLEKSKVSPTKIFNLIPIDMRKYFLLGLIDGDGCFYYNKNQYTRQFSITGSKNQSWELFEYFFSDINVKYKITRVSNKNSGYSQIRITNKKDIKKLGDFIFDDLVVLERKYEIYKEIIK